MKKWILSLATFVVVIHSMSANDRVNSTRGDLHTSVLFNDTISVVYDDSKVDSLGVFDAKAVTMRAYTKKANASKESFMLTNNTDYLISRVEITLRYFDVEGNLLHERTEMVECNIPAHSSRQASIKSWDDANRFYFYKDKSRKGAIPYNVKVKVIGYDIRVKM